MKSNVVIDRSNRKTIVYKYRSCCPRNIEMIANHTIWASTFNQLDDNVFEGQINDKVVERLDLLAKIPGAPVAEVKSKWVDLRKHVDEVGIYSLSQSTNGFADNVRMWAEYGDSNKGFCLGFDLDMLLDSEEYQFMLDDVKVNYSESVPSVTLEDLYDYTGIYTKLLGTKHTRWEYQNEIRVVYEKPGIHSYNPYALKEVYFGVMASDEDKQRILDALKGCELDIFQVQRRSGSYELDAYKIKHISRDIPRLLEPESYEILAKRDYHTAETYDVLYKAVDMSKDAITSFIRTFEKQYGVKRININLFKTRDVLPLLDKFPLTDEEDSFYNGCLIATKFIDSDEVIIAL